MVIFRDYPPFANYVVRVTNLTRDGKAFLSWLDKVEYSMGGYNSSAIGEALGAAFQVCKSEMLFFFLKNPVILICICPPVTSSTS